MTDPAEIVSGIFSVVVMIVVLVLLYGSLQGWDIISIVNIISSLAVPFTVLLILFFFALSIYQEI